MSSGWSQWLRRSTDSNAVAGLPDGSEVLHGVDEVRLDGAGLQPSHVHHRRRRSLVGIVKVVLSQTNKVVVSNQISEITIDFSSSFLINSGISQRPGILRRTSTKDGLV